MAYTCSLRSRAVELTEHLAILRRSLAMLNNDQMAGLKKEQAMELVDELEAARARLDHMGADLRRLADGIEN